MRQFAAPSINAETPADAAHVLRYGQVCEVNRADGTCRVEMGELITPPIPWAERAQGGTRTWSPPKIGEQVMLFAPEGELEAAIAMRGVASDDHPPIGDMDRELIRFEDGAEVAYNPTSHAMEITLPEGGTVTITGNVTITGSLTVSEDITVDGIALRHHKHSAVQAGGGQSGEPL